MADTPSFEVPSHLRDLAETSLDQARTAFAIFIEAARRTSDTVQGSVELARKLAAVRSLPEATQIQTEFVRERFAALLAQAQDLNGLAQRAFQ